MSTFCSIVMVFAMIPAQAFAEVSPKSDQPATIEQTQQVTDAQATENKDVSVTDSQTASPAGTSQQSLSSVYVSASGDDSSGTGTSDMPYATLAKAYESAADGATIYVVSNMAVDDAGAITTVEGRSVTITSASDRVTLTGSWTPDSGQGMFATVSKSAKVTFANIVLNGAGISSAGSLVSVADGGSVAIAKDAVVDRAGSGSYAISVTGDASQLSLEDNASVCENEGTAAVDVESGTIKVSGAVSVTDNTAEDANGSIVDSNVRLAAGVDLKVAGDLSGIIGVTAEGRSASGAVIATDTTGTYSIENAITNDADTTMTAVHSTDDPTQIVWQATQAETSDQGTVAVQPESSESLTPAADSRDVIYVEWSSNAQAAAAQDGTVEHPYTTLARGYSEVANGGTIYLKWNYILNDASKALATTDGVTKNVTIASCDESGALSAPEDVHYIRMRWSSSSVYVPAIQVNGGSTVTLSNIIIDGNGNQPAAETGLISLAGTGSLTVASGVTVRGSVGANHGIYTSSNYTGTVTIGEGTTFTSNVSTGNGAAICMNGGTLQINGGTFSDNTATGNGGAVYAKPCNFSTNGGTFSGNTATGDGGAVFTGGSAAGKTISGSTFTGNTATGNGGAVYVGQNYDGKTISGSTFTGNTAQNGGALYIDNNNYNNFIETSTFTGNKATGNGGAIWWSGYGQIKAGTMVGTEDSGNSANYGGGVYVGGESLRFSGSAMSNSANTGGGVYLYGGKLYLEGSPVVIGNTNTRYESDDVHLPEGKYITMDTDLSLDASVGVYCDGSGRNDIGGQLGNDTSFSDTGHNLYGKVFNDKDSMLIAAHSPDNQYQIVWTKMAAYVSSNGSDTNGNGSFAHPYATLEHAGEVSESGATIFVEDDISTGAYGDLIAQSDKYLYVTSCDANGNAVTSASGAHTVKVEYSIEPYAALIVGAVKFTNITLDGNGIESFNDSDSGIVTVGNAGSVTIGSGCTIKGASGKSHGVYAMAGATGTVTVEPGASISDNSTTTNGAAICFANGGTLHVNGGTFNNNKTTNTADDVGHGAAFYLNTGTTGNYINSATITDCQSANGRGIIYYDGGQSGTLTSSSDTKISVKNGGYAACILQKGGTFTAAGYIGGTGDSLAVIDGGTFTMTSTGSFDSSSADNGIVVNNGSTVNMAGTMSIGNGYGIKLENGNLDMSGTICYCKRALQIDGGTVVISGVVRNNHEKYCGGGIYLGGGDVTISGSVYQNDSHFGGGIYQAGGTLTITPTGKVDYNRSLAYLNGDWAAEPGNGGGICLAGGTLNMYGRVEGNYTYKDDGLQADYCGQGGGITVDGGTCNMYGEVSGNKAAQGGGILYMKGALYVYGNVVSNSAKGSYDPNPAVPIGSGILVYNYCELYLEGHVNDNVGAAGIDMCPGKIALSGDAQVKGNGVDLRLSPESVDAITVVGKLSSIASIGVVGPDTVYGSVHFTTHIIGHSLGNITVDTPANEGQIYSETAANLVAVRDPANRTRLVWGSKNTYVSNTGSDDGNGSIDSPFATLAKAGNAVQDGGTIYVMNDLTLTSTSALSVPAKRSVTVTSCDSTGAAVTSAADAHSIKVADASAANAANIKGNVTFTNIVFDGCGVEASGSGTGSTDSGMVRASEAGNVTIGSGCTFKNIAGYSHGIYAEGGYIGTITIDDGATFSNNSTKTNGAAIYLYNGGTLNVNAGTFTKNTATVNGGAISCNASAENYQTLHNCTFSGNTAGSHGGAVYLEDGKIGLSGTVKTTGNTGTGGTDNIYANSHSIDVVGGLTSDSVIGVRGSYNPVRSGLVGFASEDYTNINKITCDENSQLIATRDSNSRWIVWSTACSVTNDITGGTADGESTAMYGQKFSETITPTSPRVLPTTISVSAGGIQLDSSLYTYDATTGEVTIPASHVSGDIIVKATCPKAPASANPITVSDYSGMYDGAPHSITAAAELDGSTLYYSADNATWSLAAPTWIDATDGAQAVYVKAVNPNCEDSTATATVTITKSSGNSVTATAFKGTYDGQNHTITASADRQGSTLLYSETGGESATDWSTTAPAFWRAGTYTVYVKATNPNYADSDIASATVTITKRDVTITADSATLPYTGDEQFVFSGTYIGVIDGDELAARNPDDPYSSMPYICSGTDAGTYYGHLEEGKTMDVLAKVTTAHGDATVGTDVTDCYNMSLVMGSLTITKASGNSVDAADQSYVYDGTAHAFQASAAKDGSTFLYSTDNATWSAIAPKLTNVGTQTVYVKATNKNYEDTAVVTAALSVTPRSVTVTADNKTKPAEETDPTFTATVDGLVDGESPTLISYNIKRETGEGVGKYAIIPSGAASQGNYNVSYAPGTLTITPNVVNHLIATSYNGTYDGNSHTISVAASEAGSSIYYSTDNATWSATAPTRKDVTAAQTVYVKATNPKCEDVFGSATVTITAAPIVVRAASDSKVFDGTALTNSGYSVEGNFVEGEGLASVVVEGSQTHVGTSNNTATGCTFKDGTSPANYSVIYATGTLTVSKATDNTVVTSSYTGTYDGVAHGITATPKISDGTTLQYSTDNTNWFATAPTLTNVGTQTVYVKATNPDCEDATANATIIIGTAPLTVTAGSKTFVYDGSAHSDSMWSITSGKLFGTDKINVAVTGAITNVEDSPVTNVVGDVTFTSGAASNYSITKINGKLTMMPSGDNTVTVTPYNGTYDGKTHTVTATASRHEATVSYSTDKTNWDTEAPAFTNVGTYTVYVKADASGYTEATGQAEVTITRAPLTITADDMTFYFGDTVTGFTASETGYVNGETSESADISYRFEFNDDTTLGAHAIKLVGAPLQGNYSITYINGTATIVKAPASRNPITATGWSGTYDGAAHGITADPYRHTDTTLEYRTDNSTWSTTMPTFTNVGSYTVYVEAVNPNYETSYGRAVVSISKRPLTLTGATDTQKIYTGSAIELTSFDQSQGGLVSGQSLSGITYSALGTNAGTYGGAFNGTAVIKDASNVDVTSNYSIATTPGTLTISKAPSTDNAVTATGYSGVYEEEAYNITASAAQAGSTLYYSTDNATWTETVPTLTNVGTLRTYVKAVNANYEDSFADATVTITQRPLIVVGYSDSVTYTGAVQTITTIGAPGLISGNSVTGITFAASGKDKGEYQGAFTGTATVTNEGGTDVTSNYSISYEPGTLTIEAAPIVPTIVIEPQTYTGQGLTPKATVTFTDATGTTVTLVEGTDYTISDYTSNVNAGTASCVVTLMGNYSGSTMKHFNIKPAPIAAPTYKSSLTYNGSEQVSVSTTTADRFVVIGGSATDAGSYTATVVLKDKKNTVWSDGSAASRIYLWSILPTPVTVTAQDASKTYGTADPALTVKVEGLISDDPVSLISYRAIRTAGEHVGSYTITPSGKSTQGNYAVTYVPGTFTITPASTSDVTVDAVPAQLYTGSAIEPDLTVRLGEKVLTEGTDYTVVYSNNTNRGVAGYTVQFSDNFTGGAKTGTFLIASNAFDAKITLENEPYTYTGSAITPQVKVELDGETLTAGTDYTVSATNNVNAGQASYAVTFSNLYGGLVKRGDFNITKATLSAAYAGETVTYGTAPKLTVDVTGFVGGETAATAAGYVAPILTSPGAAIGDYQLTPSGGAAQNYEFVYTAGMLVISPIDASSFTVTGIDSSYTYTGSPIAPKPVVKYGDTTLVEGTDYDVTFLNNTDPGQASWKVTFKGNYAGEKSGAFTIQQKREADLEAPDGITQSGLDKVLEAVASASPEAGSVIVDLKVSEASAGGNPAIAIKSLDAASGLTFDRFYDAVLTKNVNGVVSDIGSSNDMLIGVTYPFDFTGKDQVRVFAYHNGEAYELAESPNSYGEYVVLDRGSNTVAVFAKRYSTFAVGYTTSAPASTATTKTASRVSSTTLPRTGDTTQLLVPIGLALVGAALVIGACMRRRNERHKSR